MHTGRMSCHCTKKGVNYYVNNNHAYRLVGYVPQILRPIVYALQNFDRNFANLVAPPAKRLVRRKVLLIP